MESYHSAFADFAQSLFLSVLGLLLWANLAVMLYSLILIIRPTLALDWSERLSQWVSLRRSMKRLEQPRSKEPLIYRHHRLIGTAIVLGSTAALLQMLLGYDHSRVVQNLTATLTGQTAIADWLATSVVTLFVLGMTVSLVVGYIVATRPSLLKPLEKHLNRWISARQLMRETETPNFYLDSLLHHHPRLLGTVLLSFSAYVVILTLSR